MYINKKKYYVRALIFLLLFVLFITLFFNLIKSSREGFLDMIETLPETINLNKVDIEKKNQVSKNQSLINDDYKTIESLKDKITNILPNFINFQKKESQQKKKKQENDNNNSQTISNLVSKSVSIPPQNLDQKNISNVLNNENSYGSNSYLASQNKSCNLSKVAKFSLTPFNCA